MTRITVTQGVMDISVSLTAHDCAWCGVVFAIPDRMTKERREDGQTFYCPNGHSLSYHESDTTKLRRQLADAKRDVDWFRDAEQREREQRQIAERSLTATKGVVTKMRKRAIAGACQFCHRTFANVARHVASQHPDERP